MLNMSDFVIDRQKFGNKTLIQLEWASHHRVAYQEKTLLRSHDYGENVLPSEVLKEIDCIPTYSEMRSFNAPVSVNLQRMEAKCPAIGNLLSKTHLSHQERVALLLVYMRLGNDGEQRLIEIMSWQENFNLKITKTQIEGYKRKGKFLGVSCQKLRGWSICPGECNNG